MGSMHVAPWFSCACCPGNVARFVPSVGGYFYAQKDRSLYVNLYGAGRATFTIPGTTVVLEQKTNYPWDGDVAIEVSPEKSTVFDIRVRIPGWALEKPIPSDLYKYETASKEKPVVYVNDKAVPLTLQQGYVVLNRTWKKGDRIRIHLPMPVRELVANAKVEADAGKVAVERGPLVYCAEWPDNNGHVLNLLIDDKAPLTGAFRPDLLHGVYTVSVAGKATSRVSDTGNEVRCYARHVDTLLRLGTPWRGRNGSVAARQAWC